MIPFMIHGSITSRKSLFDIERKTYVTYAHTHSELLAMKFSFFINWLHMINTAPVKSFMYFKMSTYKGGGSKTDDCQKKIP